MQHRLCIYLVLAELLGFDLEGDMKTSLRGARWMKKEFVSRGFGQNVRPPGVWGTFYPGIKTIPEIGLVWHEASSDGRGSAEGERIGVQALTPATFIIPCANDHCV